MNLIVVLRDGTERTIAAADGLSAMEAIRAAGIDEIPAFCGGNCSCASCHVYVDPAFAGRLPAPSADEEALLGSSTHLTDQSRLACQLALSMNLDGLRVRVAPAEPE